MPAIQAAKGLYEDLVRIVAMARKQTETHDPKFLVAFNTPRVHG